MKIIPTIFAKNISQFNERFNKLLKVSKNLQIDFIDGKFVKSKSVQIREIPNLKKYKNKFEAHLMTKSPEKYLLQLKQKGFKKIIFHYESTSSPEKVIEKTKSLHLETWIAINPETKISVVFPYLKKVQGILVMGVHPGKEHQNLIPSTIKKIKQLRQKSKIQIQVDGGVNEKTALKLFKAGANYLNSGSFVADSENPKEAIKKLSKWK